SRHHLRQLVVKLDAKLNRLAGRDRTRKSYLGHSMVIRILIIGRYEFELLRQIPLADDFKLLDVDGAEIAWLPLFAEIIAMSSASEGGVRLKSVQVEVKRKNRERLTGLVFVSEDFGRLERVGVGLVAGVDHVVHDPIGQRSVVLSGPGTICEQAEEDKQCRETGFHRTGIFTHKVKTQSEVHPWSLAPRWETSSTQRPPSKFRCCWGAILIGVILKQIVRSQP